MPPSRRMIPCVMTGQHRLSQRCLGHLQAESNHMLATSRLAGQIFRYAMEALLLGVLPGVPEEHRW